MKPKIHSSSRGYEESHFQIFKLTHLLIFFLASFTMQAQSANELEKPVINGVIEGPDKVCLTVPYTYSILENDPEAVYVWRVTNGEVIGSNTGKEIDIVFSKPDATVSVEKQVVKNGTTHRSDPLEIKVNPISATLEIVNIDEQTEFYTSSTATFSLKIGDIVPDHIEWSIKSSRGSYNFGNIIDGMYSDTVTVSFNEISSSPTGVLIAQITKCGLTAVATYPINLKSMPTDMISKADCPEVEELDTRFTLSSFEYCTDKTVTLTIPGYNPENRYVWYFNGTSFIADSKHTKIQFAQEGDYVIRLEITNPDGCSFLTHHADSQSAHITKANFYMGNIVPDNADFCENKAEPLTYMPVPFGISTDIIWMKDNQEVGRGKSFEPTQSGLYWVVLVDSNGCKYFNMVHQPVVVKICKNKMN